MNSANDEFRVVARRCRTETKVQGSRFIGDALPVQTRHDVEQMLDAIRKELWDATHHCYAYRIGHDTQAFRFFDDGEPGGSAGKPILAAIDKFALTDTLVMVTRYFGGTKLGVGGLVRAYGGAAALALEQAGMVTRFLSSRVIASFSHAQISNVMHVVSKSGANIVETAYDDEVHLTFEIRRSHREELMTTLINATKGTIALKEE